MGLCTKLNLKQALKSGLVLQVVFLSWFAVSASIWFPVLARSLRAEAILKAVKGLTDEERALYQITGELYRFLRFCKDRLAPADKCVFYNSPDNYDNNLHYQWDMQVVGYFLYPVRVYVTAYNEGKDIFADTQYILVFGHPDRAFPGYELFAGLEDDQFILRKRSR